MKRLPWLNKNGQSTIEFSFALIILLLIFITLGGLARITYNWMILQYAASEGARYGSLGRIDAGFSTREDSIRHYVTDITDNLGLDSVSVEFSDDAGGTTAGAASRYFRMKISRPLEFRTFLGILFKLAGLGLSSVPAYEISAWTVIRNEPF